MYSISSRTDIVMLIDFTYESLSLSQAGKNSVKYGPTLNLNNYSLWGFLLNTWGVRELFVCLVWFTPSFIGIFIIFADTLLYKDLNVSNGLPRPHELLRWVVLYNNSNWKSPLRGLLFYWLESILEEKTITSLL